MFVLVRALTYALLFVALVLVFLPTQVLSWSGGQRPAEVGLPQVIGLLLVAAGGGLALWCVLAFALMGRGTPAPFDPPRRLVVEGPYRFVRNPMYVGAAVAPAGALFFVSATLAAFAALIVLIAHLVVVVYEEPTLRRTFGPEYEAYCRRVRRWLPRRSPYREDGP